MRFQEILGVDLDPDRAMETLAQIAIMAQTQQVGPEIEQHHFHSRAELIGYKLEGILHEAGLFGNGSQMRLKGEKEQ